MKKLLMIVCVVLVSSFVLTGCKKKEVANPEPTPKPRKTDKNVNQEPIGNRPYVRLVPQADGKAITLEVVSMKKASSDMEYEIEYSSGSLLQGAFGTIDSLAKLPVTKQILLGSCSTGGKCTYNKDVSGGNLTLRFGNPDYTLKNEWSYTDQAKKQTVLTSRDGKFSVDLSKAKNSAQVAIVYNSPGYPGEPGEVIAGPYTVTTAGDITGSVTISMRLPVDATDGAIKAWDGTSWADQKTILKDREVMTTGKLSQTYVIVKK